jgi:hypothetical protein
VQTREVSETSRILTPEKETAAPDRVRQFLFQIAITNFF